MKSIYEAAKEYAESKSSAKVFQDVHIEDFKAGIEFAERWISVDDELPEFFGIEFHVLGKCKVEQSVMLVIIECQDDINNISTEFTHWRPINHK